jgi:hypothetical protein
MSKTYCFILSIFVGFVYVFINKQSCSKLDDKNTRLMFVGYNIISKGYKLWKPNTKRWGESVDVIFDETSTYNIFISKPIYSTKLLQVGI